MKIQLNKKQIPHIVIVAFGILLFFMGIANHYFFRTVTFDYGNYNFAFWDYSHFRISPMPTYPGNFLQDHFSFTLMYFIPIFWLLNWITGTYTLIIIQYAFVVIAAIYTLKLIKLKTTNVWLHSAVMLYYFVLLGRYTTFSCDVNLAVISSCFIPLFLYYFETKKYIVSFVILILSLFSRENIPIWFIFIFIVLIIQHWKEKRVVLFCVGGIIVSIIYFLLLFKVFIPSIVTDEKHFTLFNYSALGATPGEALLYVIQHPVETVKLFFVNHLNDPAYGGVKAEFYLVYLVSGGIILLLRPQYLIWFIPIVAQKVLNDSFIRWGISTYYSIEVVTLLPLSVFLTLSSLKSKILQNSIAVLVCLVTIYMTIYKLDKDHIKIPWTLNPSKEKIYSKDFFDAPFNIKKVNTLLKRIPGNAKVSASNHLFPHLTERQNIYLFPTVNDAEYIVFSVFDDYFILPHELNEENRNKYLTDPNWEVIGQEYPVFLLKKVGAGNNSITNAKQRFFTDTLYCNYESIDTTKDQVLFSNKAIAEKLSRLTNKYSFSPNHSIELSPENPYSSSVTFSDIDRIGYLQISVWCLSDENRSYIVATCGDKFYLVSAVTDKDKSSNWKKLSLSFWIPQKLDTSKFKVYLWNSGQQSAYFDNLKIIKRYKK